MFYVITSTCIDVKDSVCQTVCPVECIYEGGRMFYIQPDECINCGLCVSVCPVEAIYKDEDVPEKEKAFTEANAQFFGPEIGPPVLSSMTTNPGRFSFSLPRP